MKTISLLKKIIFLLFLVCNITTSFIFLAEQAPTSGDTQDLIITEEPLDDLLVEEEPEAELDDLLIIEDEPEEATEDLLLEDEPTEAPDDLAELDEPLDEPGELEEPLEDEPLNELEEPMDESFEDDEFSEEELEEEEEELEEIDTSGPPFSITGNAKLNLPTLGKFDATVSAEWQMGALTIEASIKKAIKFQSITINNPKVKIATNGNILLQGTATYKGKKLIAKLDVHRQGTTPVPMAGMGPAIAPVTPTTIPQQQQGQPRGKFIATFRGDFVTKKPLKPFKDIPGLKNITVKNPYVGISIGAEKGIFFGGESKILGLTSEVKVKTTNNGTTLIAQPPLITKKATTTTSIPGMPPAPSITSPMTGISGANAKREKWKLSKLSKILKPIEKKLIDPIIIVSSYNYFDRDFQINVNKGITLVGKIDPNHVPGINKIIKRPKGQLVTFSGTLGLKPRDTRFSVIIPVTLKLAKNVTLKDLRAILGGIPPSFTFQTNVEVKDKKRRLIFTGAMDVDVTGAFGIAASMRGRWKDPFGLRGINLSDVGFEFGARPVPPPVFIAPTRFGFIGSMRLGDIKTEIGTKVNITDPSQIAFVGKINKLTLRDLMSIPKAAGIKIPTKGIPNAGLSDVELSMVPGGAIQIAGINKTYPSGIRFSGKLKIHDKYAFVNGNIKTNFAIDSGLVLAGGMSNLHLGPLHITGAGPDRKRGTKDDGPILQLDMTMQKQSYYIEGEIELLGIRQKTKVNITTKGYDFKIEGKIGDLFKVIFSGKSKGSIKNLDFMIKGEFQNDFYKAVKERSKKDIERFQRKARKDIDKAKRKIDEINRETKKLDKQIDKRKRKIKRLQEKADKRVAQNRKNIQKAKDKVNRAKKDIRKAEKKISEARKKVNKTERKCKKLNHWYSKPAYWACRAVFWATRKTLKAVEKGVGASARAGLWVAQRTLDVAKATAVLDPRGTKEGALIASVGIEIASLESAKGILIASRETAKGILEGAKQAAIGLGEVGKFFAKGILNIEKILNLEKAYLYASLKELIHGKTPELYIRMTLFGRRKASKFLFDVKHPDKSVASIAKGIVNLIIGKAVSKTRDVEEKIKQLEKEEKKLLKKERAKAIRQAKKEVLKEAGKEHALLDKLPAETIIRIKSLKNNRYYYATKIHDIWRLQANITNKENKSTYFKILRKDNWIGFTSETAENKTLKSIPETDETRVKYEVRLEGQNFDKDEQWTIWGGKLKECWLKSRATNSFLCNPNGNFEGGPKPRKKVGENVAWTQYKPGKGAGNGNWEKLAIEIVKKAPLKEHILLEELPEETTIQIKSLKNNKYYGAKKINDIWRLQANITNKDNKSTYLKILRKDNWIGFTSETAENKTLKSIPETDETRVKYEVRLEGQNFGKDEQWTIWGSNLKKCWLKSHATGSFLCNPDSNFEGGPKPRKKAGENVAWTQYKTGKAAGSGNWEKLEITIVKKAPIKIELEKPKTQTIQKNAAILEEDTQEPEDIITKEEIPEEFEPIEETEEVSSEIIPEVGKDAKNKIEQKPEEKSSEPADELLTEDEPTEEIDDLLIEEEPEEDLNLEDITIEEEIPEKLEPIKETEEASSKIIPEVEKDAKNKIEQKPEEKSSEPADELLTEDEPTEEIDDLLIEEEPKEDLNLEDITIEEGETNQIQAQTNVSRYIKESIFSISKKLYIFKIA